MKVDELFELIQAGQGPQMLDVRTQQERLIARLEPSFLIPLHELSQRVEELESFRERPLVVYCHHGIRSRYAVDWLQHMGYHGAINLEGGIDAWSIIIDPGISQY